GVAGMKAQVTAAKVAFIFMPVGLADNLLNTRLAAGIDPVLGLAEDPGALLGSLGRGRRRRRLRLRGRRTRLRLRMGELKRLGNQEKGEKQETCPVHRPLTAGHQLKSFHYSITSHTRKRLKSGFFPRPTS